MKTNANDTAFPIINPTNNEGHPGLTKREYFAAMALQGILSNEELRYKIRQDNELSGDVATKFADQLIEQLNKESK